MDAPIKSNKEIDREREREREGVRERKFSGGIEKREKKGMEDGGWGSNIPSY